MGILEKMRLDGKTAFVTGGARGIGKSVAAALCEAGSNVAVVDVDYQEAEKTASELQTLGTGVIAVSCLSLIHISSICSLRIVGPNNISWSPRSARIENMDVISERSAVGRRGLADVITNLIISKINHKI